MVYFVQHISDGLTQLLEATKVHFLQLYIRNGPIGKNIKYQCIRLSVCHCIFTPDLSDILQFIFVLSNHWWLWSKVIQCHGIFCTDPEVMILYPAGSNLVMHSPSKSVIKQNKHKLPSHFLNVAWSCSRCFGFKIVVHYGYTVFYGRHCKMI